MTTPNKKIAVYRIVNTVSGSYYVGSSTNLYERWRTHRKKLRAGVHPNPKLQATWAKHGEAVFQFVVLAEFESASDMEACEEALLQDCAGDPKCCNLSLYAKSPFRGMVGEAHPGYGKTISDEAKAALRAATKRQWEVDDPRTGKTHSEEAKQKISAKVQAALAEGRGGKFIPSPETRAKMAAAAKGNQHAKGHVRSAEHRAKLSAAQKGNTHWLGKTHTAESRAKMGRPVVAVDPAGAETAYATITELRAVLGLTPPTVHRALESGRPLSKGHFAGWSFRRA